MGDFTKFSKAFKQLIGTEPSASNLKNRIIVQKIAYLLQKKNIDFKYSFRWYIYGVFSWNLWVENQNNKVGYTKTAELSSQENSIIEELKNKQALKDIFFDLAEGFLGWTGIVDCKSEMC